ncbi:MAG: helix-turn-helix domain-containing protein [Sterolibacterium sp.]
MAKDTATSAEKVLRCMVALKGHTLSGLSNQELSRMTGFDPSSVTRYMQTLIEVGLVTKLDNGRFAHSVTLLQIAFAHAEHVERTQNRISEINQRIAAGAA